MIGFDFLDIIFHELLVVSTIVLERQQLTHPVIHIHKAGFHQPFWGYALAEHIVKQQGQQSIAFNQQVVYEQLLIDGLYDLASFCRGLLIKILSVKNFAVIAKSTNAVVIDHSIYLYGAVLQHHSFPATQHSQPNFKFALAVGQHFDRSTNWHHDSVEISIVCHFGHGSDAGVVARSHPVNVTPVV